MWCCVRLVMQMPALLAFSSPSQDCSSARLKFLRFTHLMHALTHICRFLLWFLSHPFYPSPLSLRSPRLSQLDQGHEFEFALEAGLLGQSIGQEGKQADAAQGLTPEARAMQEKHRLEVASLEQKLSSSLEALEAKNTELRESQRRQESLEAKLDEEREDARRLAEEHKELKAKSEQELTEAQRIAEERKELLDELKKTTAPGSLTASTRTDLQTPATSLTTRGIPSSLARSLDDARADTATGMRKHDEVDHNYDILLHEPPQVVLEELMGNSLKSGVGDLRQQVRECEEWGNDMEPVQTVEQFILTM